jgi:LmbE family N-acetylglucosaminyl deacetylase
MRVLVVVAHPDDAECGFGATIAALAGRGAAVACVVCSDGSQGGEDPSVPDADLVALRRQEQLAAARTLGITDVAFLGLRDGALTPDAELRCAIARQLRRVRPQLVVTHLPWRALAVDIEDSHPDHLAVGEAALAAVQLDAASPRAFPELLAEGLPAHRADEVWLAGLEAPDLFVDATRHVENAIAAVACHRSQFPDPAVPRRWMTAWMRRMGQLAGCEYADGYRRVVVRGWPRHSDLP